ncbi:C3a anaphylatoxin chemotactic receptor [Pogona vitticeps]|nr:C3a anaphylatoxin chemotactic receptor [Pogona vitticeps]
MSPFLANESLYKSDGSLMLHHTPTSISMMAIFSLIFLLGLPGNGLVIWVVTLKMKPSVNTTWFLHLAVADFVCCLSLPFNIVHLALHDHWPYGWFFCKIIPSAILLNMFASVFLLTTISIDRCLVVMKPIWCQNHRTVRFASLICGGIWLLAFIMCCPAFFYRETSIDELGNTKCIYSWYGEEYQEDKELGGPFSSDNLFLIHPTLMAGGIYEDPLTDGILDTYPKYHMLNTAGKTNALPSSISNSAGSNRDASLTTTDNPTKFPKTPMNTAISNTSNSNVPPVSFSMDLSANNDSVEMYYYGYFPDSQPPKVFVSITVTRAVFGFFLPFGIMATCYALITHRMLKRQFAKLRRKTMQVILLIVATFFLCWAPYNVIGLLYLLVIPGTEFSGVLALWDHISTVLAYANSCINPLLYVFVGKKFREKARQTVQEVFEAAFSEEGTWSTGYSQDRSKTTLERGVGVSAL